MKIKFTRELFIRILFFVVGSAIIAFGCAVYVLTQTGNDCFGALMEGVAKIIGIENGTAHIVINLLYLAVILLVDRKYIKLGTIISMFVMGPVINFSTNLLRDFFSGDIHYLIRISIALVCCIVLSFGLSVIMYTNIGVGPNDLVPILISDKTKFQFRWVRLTVDVISLSIGFFLGGTVGLVTILNAVMVGPITQFFTPLSKKMIDSATKKNNY